MDDIQLDAQNALERITRHLSEGRGDDAKALIELHLPMIQEDLISLYALMTRVAVLGRDDNLLAKIIFSLRKNWKNLAPLEQLMIVQQEIRMTGRSDLASDLDQENREIAEEFRAFLESNPVPLRADEAARWLGSERALSFEDAADEVISAIRSQSPYSFVRMGDGEGRFMFNLDKHPGIRGRTLSTAQNIWFWNSSYFPTQEFFDELGNAYLNADLIGINPPYRIELKSRNDILGYLGVINGNKFVFSKSSGKSRIIENWAPALWDRANFFMRLFEEANEVSFISPHSSIVTVMSEKYPKKEITNVLIPSENHPLVAPGSMREPHYPRVYHEILDYIRGHPGKTFLVAGGVFGKIYCEHVKRVGGVAVDIGSLADTWMGLRTRG